MWQPSRDGLDRVNPDNVARFKIRRHWTAFRVCISTAKGDPPLGNRKPFQGDFAMARKTKNVSQVENEAPETPAAEAAPKAESKPICLVPGCGREAKVRQLCSRCCTAARAQIKKGKTTWADLERLGLAAAPKKSALGGEPGVFAKALKNALGGEGN
jgi:hypothetical protein